jgi:predicted nucleotidyltransferase
LEPLIHLILPLTALTLLGVDFRKALPLALFGLLPDLDALLLIHRSLSHSLPVLLAFAAGAALLAYAVILGLQREEVTTKIAQLLTGFPEVVFAALFGSLATRGSSGHDIDIAVKVKDGDKYTTLARLFEELSTSVPVNG